jgi:hypothetical protein
MTTMTTRALGTFARRSALFFLGLPIAAVGCASASAGNADADVTETSTAASPLLNCPPDQSCAAYPTPPKPIVRKPLPPPLLTQVSVWPNNDSHYWTEELQGITHDDANWYLASREHVMRFALTDDLHDNPNVRVGNPWASVWSHIGSPAYANATVVIPLERNGTGVAHFEGLYYVPQSPTMATRAALGVLGTDLSAVGVAVLPTPPAGTPDEQGGGDNCPWVSYNAKDGLFYSSAFNANFIYAYSIQLNPVRATFARAIPIVDTTGAPISLTHLQGGAISDTNKLYVLSDAEAGAIYAIDLANGQVQLASWVDHDPSFFVREELEGITIFDATGKGAPGIEGQLHVLLLDNDASKEDDWYFKHYRASRPL